MRVAVVRPDELGPTESQLWARLQKSSPLTLSPFLSYTFARVVGAARSQARVAVVEDGGTIEAFIPFELAGSRVGIPIGWPMNDLQGFITAGGPLDARSIVRKAGLRALQFHTTPAGEPTLAHHYYEDTTVSSSVIDLTNGYKPYLDSRSKTLTSRIIRQRRLLERSHGAVSFQWGAPLPACLPRLVEWKSSKYPGFSRFSSQDASAIPIIEQLSASASEDCRGLMSALSVDGRPAAVLLGLAGFGGLTGWLPGYDRDLSRFSPGILLWFFLAEEAARKGITRIDLGWGQHAYKFSLANDFYPVGAGAVWASRAEGTARRIYRRLYYNRRHHGNGTEGAAHRRPGS